MVNYVSPGVYVIEKDLSDYTPSLNPTVVGIVGFASKGKPNKATLITSQQKLVETFGEPRESLPGQGLEGALEILETCNQLYYVRALDTATATDSSGMVTLGACPAVAIRENGYGVTNPLYLKVQVTDNAGTNQYTSEKTFAIPAGTGTGTQAQAIASVVGGSLDNAAVGSYFATDASAVGGVKANLSEVGASGPTSIASSVGNFIVGNFAGENAQLTVKAYTDSAYTTDASAIYLLNASGFASGASGIWPYGQHPVNGVATTVEGDTSGPGFPSATVNGWTFKKAVADGFSYTTESLFEGTGYSLSTLTDGTVIGNSITIQDLGNRNNNLLINDGGSVAESFKVSLAACGSFVEDVINTGEVDNVVSDYIKGNLTVSGADMTGITGLYAYWTQTSGIYAMNNGNFLRGSGGYWKAISGSHMSLGEVTNAAVDDQPINPRFVKMVAGTYGLSGGTDGVGSGDSETTALVGVTSPSRTGMQALNDDVIPITMAAVPGITTESVQNNLVTLAETTGDFLAVLGTPLGVGGVQDAIDFSNGLTTYRSAALNSSYAALYFPQIKVFNSYLSKDIWLDPAVFALRQMGFTDSVADLWFAPAGFVRGRITKAIDTEYSINQGDRDSMYSGGNVVNPIVNFAQQGITIFGQRTTQRSPTALDRVNVRRLMLYVKAVIKASTQRFIFEPNDKITQERITALLVPLFGDIQSRRGITEFKVICDETVNTPVRVDRNELWCKVLIKPTKAAEVLVFELNLTSQAASL
tara:strand:+ start:68153 stop:70423 length:2271 start_codon:yes stop_codon:yes gene_type:complete